MYAYMYVHCKENKLYFRLRQCVSVQGIHFVLLRQNCRRIHKQLRRQSVTLYINIILVFETYTKMCLLCGTKLINLILCRVKR